MVLDKEGLVKQDKNFLEYPDHTLARYPREKHPEPMVIENSNGTYRLSTSEQRYPNRTDKVFLYYFLKKIWENKFKSREIQTTRYRVSMDVFGGRSKTSYDRIIGGLKKWMGVSIEFNGIFYDGNNYTTRFFGIIDDAILDKGTGKLIVRFNEQYLEQLKHTQYYRKIDWKKFKQFKKDITARLYEILLIRSLPWKIEVVKLAKKLTLKRKYPSDILQKVKPAVNELKNIIPIGFSSYKNDVGETICVFSKFEENSQSDSKETSKIPVNDYNRHLGILLKVGVNREVAEKVITEHDIETIAGVIREVQDIPDAKNPPGLMISRLNTIKVQQEQKRLESEARIKEAERKKAEEKAKEDEEEILRKRAREYFDSLSESERLALKEKSEKSLRVPLKLWENHPERKESIIMTEIENNIMEKQLPHSIMCFGKQNKSSYESKYERVTCKPKYEKVIREPVVSVPEYERVQKKEE